MELRDTISRYDDGLLGCSDDDCPCCIYEGDSDDKEKYDAIVRQAISWLDVVEKLSTDSIYTQFIKDEPLQQQFMDLLEYIQNTILLLPDDYTKNYMKVDWVFLQTLKEQIIHPTFGQNPETLWDIIRMELPDLNRHLGVVVNGCGHSQ